MKLGQLIKALETCQQDALIQFDFCRCTPTRWHSCRGNYADLAVSWEVRGTAKVSDFLAETRKANGQEFTGWKGGEYTMDEQTPIGVDLDGEWTNTKIVGVRDLGYGYVIIDTRNED